MLENHINYSIESGQSEIECILKNTRDVVLPPVVRCETVLIMAGGFGRRMMPLTQNTPKPLLPIVGAPIIEHIIAPLISQGFVRFIISVHHMAQQVRDWVAAYSKPGISLETVQETGPLGTAGALSLLTLRTDAPLIVANADIITDLDYRKVLSAHSTTGADVTMCTRNVDFQIPYGVIETEGTRVQSVIEKPTRNVQISAGMYVLSAAFTKRVKRGERIDMPDLIQREIGNGAKVHATSTQDRWIDVGNKATYQKLIEMFGR